MHFIQNSKYFYKKKHKNFIIYLLICDKVIGKGEFIFSRCSKCQIQSNKKWRIGFVLEGRKHVCFNKTKDTSRVLIRA